MHVLYHLSVTTYQSWLDANTRTTTLRRNETHDVSILNMNRMPSKRSGSLCKPSTTFLGDRAKRGLLVRLKRTWWVESRSWERLYGFHCGLFRRLWIEHLVEDKQSNPKRKSRKFLHRENAYFCTELRILFTLQLLAAQSRCLIFMISTDPLLGLLRGGTLRTPSCVFLRTTTLSQACNIFKRFG